MFLENLCGQKWWKAEIGKDKNERALEPKAPGPELQLDHLDSQKPL